MAMYYNVDEALPLLIKYGTRLQYGTWMPPKVPEGNVLVGVLHNDSHAIALDVSREETFKTVARAYASWDWHVFAVYRVSKRVMAPIGQSSMPTDQLAPLTAEDAQDLDQLLFSTAQEHNDGFLTQQKMLTLATQKPKEFLQAWTQYHTPDYFVEPSKTSADLESITKRFTKRPAQK